MNDGSEPLPNRKHERFALLVASGEVSQAEAYRREVSPSCSDKQAWEAGSRLCADDKVKPRIAWLKVQASKRLEEEAEETILEMAEKRRICAEIARKGKRDADRLNAIKVDNDLAGEGSEAESQSALAALAARLRT